MKFSNRILSRAFLVFTLSAAFGSTTAANTNASVKADETVSRARRTDDAGGDQHPFAVHPMPPNPEPYQVTYPDGTVSPLIYLKVRGGLFSNPIIYEETADGFTVKPVGVGGKYMYIDIDEETGETFETDKVAGVDDPSTYGIHKGAAVHKRRNIFQNRKLRYDNGPGNDHIDGAVPTQGNDTNERNHSHRRTVITSGTLKNLVVPIKFSDHTGRSLPSRSDLDTIMNNKGSNTLCPTGSVRDVYLQNSFNSLKLESTVLDWITIDYTEAYCAGGESALSTRFHTCLINALDKADQAGVDFSDYDLDGDDLIDGITFFHSGYAAEWGGSDQYGQPEGSRIWSHKWSIWQTWYSNEGTEVFDYHVNPALWDTYGSDIGRIGVVAHETGHFLGLPDLYDYGDGDGIGSFGLMANSWGFDYSQYYPPLMSAWGKYKLGWVTPTVVSNSGSFTLRQACDYPDMIKISAGYPSGEYLLIENRQSCGFDSSMTQGGIVIFHIDDYANNVLGYPGQSGWPTNGNHYEVAVLPADGFYEMEKGYNRGDEYDVFHSGYRNSIGPDGTSSSSYPNTKAYQDGNIIDTGVTISNISAAGSTMTLSIQIGSTTPVASPVASPVIPPVEQPVEQPVSSPVTPPSSSTCNDGPFRFAIFKPDGKRIMRYCSWAANQSTNLRCSWDSVATMCPSTCGTCNTCVDSSARFKFYKEPTATKRITRSCIWVANTSTNARCNIEGMADTCRETCDNC
jgi:M6 family metalloprotease-like protein